MFSKKQFSLIIPCYNESKYLFLLKDNYKNFIQNPLNEMILVNNGSTDETKKILKKIKKTKNLKIVTIKKNIGFGNGLKKGIFKSTGKVIIYSHADPEVDSNDVIKIVKIYKKLKSKKKIFIKGNRVNKIKNHWSYLHIFFSYGLTILSSILFQKKIYDIHGMPVLFSKNLLDNLNYIPNDFSIDLALYVTAKRNNFNIIRFPVNFNKKKRIYGEGSSNTLVKLIKNSINQFYQSLKILINK